MNSLQQAADEHLVEWRGSTYQLLLPDAATDTIQNHIARTAEPYEPELIQDVLEQCDSGDLVIDAGANIGNHTIAWAAVGSLSVIAFEPNVHLADQIEKSALLNGVSHLVEVHREALGDHEGTGALTGVDAANLGAGYVVEDIDPAEATIPIRPLRDDGRAIKVIKIDTEGSELAILRGAEDLLNKYHPLLYVECLTHGSFVEVSDFLWNLGYVYGATFNASPTHRFSWTDGQHVEVKSSINHLATRLYQDHEAYLATRQHLLSAIAKYRESVKVADRLKAQLSEARLTRDRLQEQVDQGQGPHVSALVHSLAETQQQLADSISRESNWGRQLAEHFDVTSTWRDKANELSTDLSDCRRQLHAKSVELGAVRSEISLLEERLSDSSAHADHYAHRQTELEDQLRALTQQLGLSRDNAVELTASVSALTHERNLLGEQLQHHRSLLADQNEEVERLRSECEEQRHRAEGFHDELAGLASANERLEERHITYVANLHEHWARTRDALADAEAELMNRQAALQQLEALANSNETMQVAAERHAEDLITIRAWIEQRQQAEDAAEDALSTLEAQRDALELAKEHFRQEAANLHDLKRAASREKAALEKKLSNAAEQRDHFRSKAANLQRDLDAARNKLRQLRSSRSYRAGRALGETTSIGKWFTLPARLWRARTPDAMLPSPREIEQ